MRKHEIGLLLWSYFVSFRLEPAIISRLFAHSKDVDLVSPKGFSFLTLSTPPLHEINIPSSLTCITCPGETRLTTDSMVEPYKHNSRPLK